MILLRLRSFLLCSLMLLYAITGVRSLAQVRKDTVDALRQSAPRVFIDCFLCDVDFIKTEIPYINSVRD